VKYTTIIALILSSIALTAQAEYKPPVSFEKNIETYDVKKNGTYVLTSENVTLIETENGVNNESQADIEYNSTFDSIEILSAYTLQPDGQKILIPKDGIRTTEDPLSHGAPMFSDTKHKVIIFPNVKVGSRLCYKYRTTAHDVPFRNNFMIGAFFSPHFKFNSYIININISKELPLNVDLKGAEGGLISQSKDQNHYKFSYTQSTAVAIEPGEIELEDFAPYIVVSSFNDQIGIGQDYQKKLIDKVKVTPEIQKLADHLTENITDEREQVHAIYNWVKNNIRYVAVYLGNGGFVPHSVSTILNNRYGDCKDHAAILEALLRAKGIESSGALINSGEAFLLPKYAVANPQNHIITYVPSLDLYLDSTSQYSTFGTLPMEDLDKPVILTALSKIGHTPKMKKEDYELITDVKMKINEDGTIEGISHNQFKGVAETYFRASRVKNVEEDERAVVNRILQANGETGTGQIKSTNPLDTDTPFTSDATFTLDPVSNFPGPAAMRIPIGIAVAEIASESKNKPLEKHRFPYAWYPSIYTERYELDFPVKTKITRIPENVSFHKGVIEYDATYRLNGNKLYVTRSLVENHQGEVVQPDEDLHAKEFVLFLQKDLRSQVFYE